MCSLFVVVLQSYRCLSFLEKMVRVQWLECRSFGGIVEVVPETTVGRALLHHGGSSSSIVAGSTTSPWLSQAVNDTHICAAP
jgi:hypothetical protein